MGRQTVALLALGAALVLAPLSVAAPQAGGTFRVAQPGAQYISIDAALAANAANIAWVSTACASLMHLSDEPLPEGFRVVPELAARPPKVSADGKTYVFTIRRDARFSTGAPVTAADVAYTINRFLSPVLKSYLSSLYQPIVGAQAVLDGKATSASGVTATGRRLTIRLTHPVGDFAEGAASSLCVLPAGLPITAQGVTTPVPSAAPYYISEYVPAQQIVLERNSRYRGPRPQHVDRIVFDLTVDEAKAIDDVLQGRADSAVMDSPAFSQRTSALVRRFGINKSRFFVQQAAALRLLVLNTSRPLFRDNTPLRQAIGYAVERAALTREFDGVHGGAPADQLLPPIMPGYTDAHVYPLAKPNLAKARKLAEGHTRGGKIVLYWNSDRPAGVPQIVKQNLARIGLKVDIRSFPSSLYWKKLGTPGEPYDMAYMTSFASEPDPGAFLNALFDGGLIGTPSNTNFSNFNSPTWNHLLRQANGLTGEARYRAYGKLGVQLTRDAAPAVAYDVANAFTLVSARTGCVIANPYLDLAAVCLTR